MPVTKDPPHSRASHPSTEAKFRAWTAESSAADSEEQRLKAAATVSSSIRRRWAIIAVGFGLLLLLKWGDPATIPVVALIVVTAVAIAANLAVISINRTGKYRWWLVYCLVITDILIVGAFVSLAGPGGAVVGFLVATLPYTFSEGRWVGEVLALASAICYVLAASVHGALLATPTVGFTDVPPGVFLESATLLLVAITLRRLLASLFGRIRVTRAVMRQAEAGSLAVRAPAGVDDELGFLETSFNRMLDGTAGTIAALRRETDELFVLAEVLSQAAAGVLDSSKSVAATSAELARGMAQQRELAEEGREQSTKAAAEAGTLSNRADGVASDARNLAEAAEHSRSSVERAGEVLVAIGEDVRNTAESVHELSGMSERVGSFARTISRIARQTHVLALNAAIEAAHNEGAGEGFATIADEVRSLAAEASGSAREVTELMGDMLTRVDAVSRAMTSGEERVRNVDAVADQAQVALKDLQRGISRIKDLVDATAEISETQAARMAGLAERMANVASISSTSARQADGAASAMASQQRTIGDLKAVSVQLAALAERVRASIARFSVTDPNDSGAEHD